VRRRIIRGDSFRRIYRRGEWIWPRRYKPHYP